MTQTIHNQLPSWANRQTKKALLSFIDEVTNEASDYFVPISERIAVFDHDGTLWVEKPLMTQLEFIRDEFGDNEEDNKNSGEKSRFQRLKDSIEAVAELFDEVSGLTKEILEGLSLQEYHDKVMEWLAKEKHPKFNKHYNELAYRPMKEVIALFQRHHFQCFIVSGGTSAFIRPWCEQTYGIARQNVIGSSLRTQLVERNGKLVLEYQPVPFYFDNGDAKVRAIGRIIGKQPIAAFGNTSGDVEMLRYTCQAKRSFVALVHHTDAEREYAYSPDSRLHFGEPTLEKAKKYNWHVVDMKKDWQRIF